MRYLDIVLFILAINLSLNLVVTSGAFEDTNFFESELELNSTEIDAELGDDTGFISDFAKTKAAISRFNELVGIVSWDWIKWFFTPWYDTNTNVQETVDTLVFALNSITVLLMTMAVLEIIRNAQVRFG